MSLKDSSSTSVTGWGQMSFEVISGQYITITKTRVSEYQIHGSYCRFTSMRIIFEGVNNGGQKSEEVINAHDNSISLVLINLIFCMQVSLNRFSAGIGF